jgi:hypothetical protein
MGLLSYLKGLLITEAEVPTVLQHNLSYGDGEAAQIRQDLQLPELDADGNDPAAKVVYARLLQEGEGWTYEICKAGIAFVRQEFNPDKAGSVPMTEEEARTLSDALVRYYSSHPQEDI